VLTLALPSHAKQKFHVSFRFLNFKLFYLINYPVFFYLITF
jgi:hypothetical protein